MNVSGVFSEVQFLAYPIPSTGIIHLEFELKQKGYVKIEVMNSIGQLIQSDLLFESTGHYVHSLDLSDVATGMYLVRLTQNGISNVQRIHIQK